MPAATDSLLGAPGRAASQSNWPRAVGAVLAAAALVACAVVVLHSGPLSASAVEKQLNFEEGPSGRPALKTPPLDLPPHSFPALNLHLPHFRPPAVSPPRHGGVVGAGAEDAVDVDAEDAGKEEGDLPLTEEEISEESAGDLGEEGAEPEYEETEAEAETVSFEEFEKDWEASASGDDPDDRTVSQKALDAKFGRRVVHEETIRRWRTELSANVEEGLAKIQTALGGVLDGAKQVPIFDQHLFEGGYKPARGDYGNSDSVGSGGAKPDVHRLSELHLVGDSITAGCCCDTNSYATLLSNNLKQSYRVVSDAGSGKTAIKQSRTCNPLTGHPDWNGNTLRNGQGWAVNPWHKPAWSDYVSETNPDVVYIMLGTNGEARTRVHTARRPFRQIVTPLITMCPAAPTGRQLRVFHGKL